MQIRPADLSAVNRHRFKDACQTDHPSASNCYIQTNECGFIQFIFPLQCNQTVFMMPCGSQTFSVGNIIIFHDNSIYRVRELLRIHSRNCITHHCFIVNRIQIDIGHNRKTVMCQKLLLSKLTLRLQIIAHKLKRPKLKQSLFCFAGIELTRAAGCEISRVSIGLLQTGIDSFKVCP